jgi:hypothetical protein
MALIAGAVLAVAACDGDNVTSLTVGPGGTTGRTGSISNNHGHVATLTAAELTAGNALTLDIRGNADHSHTVELGGAEVVEIRDGQRVTTTSSTETSPLFGTHSHTVTFN